MQDSPIQDVNQAADSSDAATVATSEGAAPAGVTAAPEPTSEAQPQSAQALEFKPVPYDRFRQVNQSYRETQQELARAKAAQADFEKRIADYEAKLAKANEEPPPWMRSLIPQPKEPEFDDPLEARAYKLEKALEERDAKLKAFEDQLAKYGSSFEKYQEAQRTAQEQAKFEAKLNADVDALTKSDPTVAKHLDEVLKIVIDAKGYVSVEDAAIIFKNRYLQPVQRGVNTPNAPPMATAAAPTARPKVPPPVSSSPANLQPAVKPPRSMSELHARVLAKHGGE